MGFGIGICCCNNDPSNCVNCPSSAQFRAVVSGWVDGTCPDGTTTAPCSEFNGTYLLTAGGGPGCSYRYSGAPAGGSAFVCVPVFVLMGLDFNYNAATDTTTITWGFVNEVSGGIGGGTATRSGKPDCRSSHFGTLTVSGPANLTTGEGTDTYCDTTITIVFTSLYSP